jgi:hypothetical protein
VDSIIGLAGVLMKYAYWVSSRFQWVKTEGSEEMKGSVFTETWVYCPRYTYFVYVDEESVESVVNGAKARKEDGYFCTMVREDIVGLREQDREEDRRRRE